MNTFETTSTNEVWYESLNKIVSLAQTGIHYSKDVYDIERYKEIIACVENLINLADIPTDNFNEKLLEDIGYITPKLDVRAVVFKDNKILLVKETSDGLWSLPGGWADVGYSASENVAKEVFEETGLKVKVSKLLSFLDRRKHSHPPMFLHVYKVFFLCEIIDGMLRGSIETSEADFFALEDLPPISEARVTYKQIVDFFNILKSDLTKLETVFD